MYLPTEHLTPDMPNLIIKVLLARILPMLPAMLSVAPALSRFGPQWFAKRAGFTLAFLTRRCSGLPSATTELQR